MAIYESKGFGVFLYPYKGELEPFDYIANFKPFQVPDGVDIEVYKRTYAPYCLSGKVISTKGGSYKRNNESLVYRDLIFLDYDDLEGAPENFIGAVSSALCGYSYILYPTIKNTHQKPRYRLVVKPTDPMGEDSYRQVVKEIAEKIGLPFDSASLTWSQLQGLPVTTSNPDQYQMVVNRGAGYPVPRARQQQAQRTSDLPRRTGQKSMTMRVVDTLLHGFGDEGGRNVALTRFLGLLFNKWVDCDIETAYELTKIANSVTANPLPLAEVDRTFKSIARAEYRKR